MHNSTSREPSVDELRRDADRTRAHLTGTVEELRSQVADTATHVRQAVAPSTIKRQVKEYVRESSEDMLQSLQRRARENPLQAVAVGAGLAYPLWNLMRAIPAPLLLIGAGLALSRSTAVRDATDEAIARAREAAEEASDATRRKMDELRDSADSMRERASGLVSSMTDRVSTKASDAGSSMTQAKASMADASDAALDRGRAAIDQGRSALDAAGERITSFASEARHKLGSTYEQNPLLVAGIGLAVGALIASSLPTTTAENRLFGDTSDKLRRRAADAAAEGLDAAKEAAGNVLETAVQEASSAGEELTRKARTVAERGVQAALGETATPNPTTRGPYAQ